MEDILKKVTSGVRTPSNVIHKDTDEPKAMIIQHSDHIEICGQRIDNIDSFEDFIEYLHQRVQIEKDYAALYNERSRLIDYLKLKLEESKLDRAYIDGMCFSGPREQVYQDILDRVMEGK